MKALTRTRRLRGYPVGPFYIEHPLLSRHLHQTHIDKCYSIVPGVKHVHIRLLPPILAKANPGNEYIRGV